MRTIPFLLLALCASAFGSYRADTQLIVDVQNIKEVKGQLRVGLYKPCDNFPSGCKPIANQIVAVKGNSTRITFTVPPGDYAVALFHDVNDNGEMDKKMFGIPKEPYGFSNNYRPRVSAPDFDDCRVKVETSGKTISIKLI
ncbi:DUF2141 domain-containing protein [Larkinella arboricola]|uniref:Uncharacterized protein (DUF2141 family) n=1 Tax=Larkinella arboricola TaxID=643671 RepID=A0A327X694_LARAB|nr:DUF2141 domain-containing protein [Larkinella arboricola]RAK02455.1 uncharacterized protein (DUF2141 family) [Larkinella arboricola]